MTDLEIMERAKMYVDKMANGINPLTDEPIREDDFINNVRIARCLFYVSGVLGRVIDNGGEVGAKQKAQKPRKEEFALTAEQLEQFPFSEEPVALSVIVARANELAGDANMKKLTFKTVADKLLEAGFLEEYQYQDGTMRKRPTALGEQQLGLTFERRVNAMGNAYDVVLYGKAAQRFVVDNFCCG